MLRGLGAARGRAIATAKAARIAVRAAFRERYRIAVRVLINAGVGRIEQCRSAALAVRLAGVLEELACEQCRQYGDTAAVDAEFATVGGADEADDPACGVLRAGEILDPAATGPLQIGLDDDRVLGDQQFDHGVVEAGVHHDLVVALDQRRAQVDDDAAVTGLDLEVIGGGPVTPAAPPSPPG